MKARERISCFFGSRQKKKKKGRFHVQSSMPTKPSLKVIKNSSEKLNIILELFVIFEWPKKNKIKKIHQTKQILFKDVF